MARLDWFNNKKTKTYLVGRTERFKQIEQLSLRPLTMERYESAEWIYKVRVPNDYHVNYKNCYYSVPYQHIKKLVDLRVTESVIEILLDGKRIASHDLLESAGSICRRHEHMPAQHLYQHNENPDSLLEWAESIGPNVLEWASQNLKSRSDYANGFRSVSNLRKWARLEQNHYRLDSACAFVLKIGVLPFQRLKNVIAKNGDLRAPLTKSCKIIEHENIRGADYYGMEEHQDAQ